MCLSLLLCFLLITTFCIVSVKEIVIFLLALLSCLCGVVFNIFVGPIVVSQRYRGNDEEKEISGFSVR